MSPNFLPSTLLRILFLFGGVLTLAPVSAGQEPASGLMRLGVTKVDITPATRESVAKAGRANALDRFLQGVNTQLEHAIQTTKMFEVVSWDDTKILIDITERNQSGNVDSSNPKAAAPFKLRGCEYVALTAVTDFQDHSTTRSFDRPGKDAPTNAHRRTLRVEAVVKLYNGTTGTLVESKMFYSEKEIPESADAREVQNGSLTDKILAEMRQDLCTSVGQGLALWLVPVQVLSNEHGVLMLSHTAGAGLKTGQIWDAFQLGKAVMNKATKKMIQTESKVGEVQITDPLEDFSKGQVLSGTVAEGTILRPRLDNDKNIVVEALRQGPVVTQTPAPVLPPLPVEPGGRDGVGVRPESPSENSRRPVSDMRSEAMPAGNEPRAIAIFVKNRAKNVPDEKVMVVEDYLTDALTKFGFRVIRREDVINKLSRFATEGANKGNIDPAALDTDRILSDSTSALRLAQSLGAELV